MPRGDLMLIIANPGSGGGRGSRTSEQVARLLQDAGCPVDVRHTRSRGDGQQTVRDALHAIPERLRAVVACGGDGTIQDVAHALATAIVGADQVPPLVVAPAGRCNDFARALGMPRSSEAIAETALHGRPLPIDLGRVNDRLFCTIATLGIDAEVSGFVDSMRMPLRGMPAYVYGAFRVLARYRPSRVRITGDFGVMEKSVFLASTANTSSYGGAVRLVPDADPTDGVLNLCVIDGMSRWRALAMVPTVLLGRHPGRTGVHFIKTREFTIESETPLEVWADGERVATTPARLTVTPAALRVLLPPQSPLFESDRNRTPNPEG